MVVNARYRVNFFDTDTMGVVHHSNYIRWFELGRVAFMRAAQVSLNEMMDEGIVFPITEVECRYHSPGYFDDMLVIEVTPKALTKAKMEFDYRIMREETGELLVTGHTQNVFTSKETGKIIRIPDKCQDKLKVMLY